jgi:2-polyprenyl-3-methyl-5-hydroxy-6-metoxy-1,4-benzoquinol methylase
LSDGLRDGRERSPRRRERLVELEPDEHERRAAFKQGAIDYARNLPEWARQELYRKPFLTFTGPPEPVSLVYLRDLANLLELTALDPGASVLDVACGPGWLSEALYRFGYRVTGVDIADDLLAVARERIRTLPFPPVGRDPSWIEFHRLDIEADRLERRFDAVILYDCLHHFADAAGALANVRAMLSPRGVLVIKEGEMPPPGSRHEQELMAETEIYSTLEAPFRADALAALLDGAGFAHVRRMLPAVPLVPARESLRSRLRRAFGRPPDPPVNFFLARPVAPFADGNGAEPARWRARISLLGLEPGSDDLAIRVRVVNDGASVWTAGDDDRPETVCLGCRLFAATGERLDEHSGRAGLPRDLAPEEAVEVTLHYPWPEPPVPRGRLAVDLISRRRFWFGEQGSPVLELALPARP